MRPELSGIPKKAGKYVAAGLTAGGIILGTVGGIRTADADEPASSTVQAAAGEGMKYRLVVPGVSRDVPPPTPTPIPEVAAEPDTGIDAYGGRMVADLINQKRAELGLRQLKYNASLTTAGENYSKEYLWVNRFTINSTNAHKLDGKEPWQRARDAGYAGLGYAVDNIAWKKNTASRDTWVQFMVQFWLDSPGHRAVMMDPNIKDVGVGCYLGYDQEATPVRVAMCDAMFGMGN